MVNIYALQLTPLLLPPRPSTRVYQTHARTAASVHRQAVSSRVSVLLDTTRLIAARDRPLYVTPKCTCSVSIGIHNVDSIFLILIAIGYIFAMCYLIINTNYVFAFCFRSLLCHNVPRDLT